MLVVDIYQKAVDNYRRNGLNHVFRQGVRFVYNQIVRPRLPRLFTTEYNGTKVRALRPLDRMIPWIDDGPKPDYESALVDAVNEHVRPGDEVVVIGGGWGVTATQAAQRVSDEGSVTVYEGAASEVRKARETARLNNVADRFEVQHTIVGPAISLRGKAKDAANIEASDLPPCDVLLMDCEGAETTLLPDLEVSPRILAVESHGLYDAPSDEVADLMTDLGYDIVAKAIADDDSHETCINQDIYVLVGVEE